MGGKARKKPASAQLPFLDDMEMSILDSIYGCEGGTAQLNPNSWDSDEELEVIDALCESGLFVKSNAGREVSFTLRGRQAWVQRDAGDCFDEAVTSASMEFFKEMDVGIRAFGALDEDAIARIITEALSDKRAEILAACLPKK
jgi:hypothetical protein